jgi:hypothetical protein
MSDDACGRSACGFAPSSRLANGAAEFRPPASDRFRALGWELGDRMAFGSDATRGTEDLISTAGKGNSRSRSVGRIGLFTDCNRRATVRFLK